MTPKFRPVLDSHFEPPALWNRAFRAASRATGKARPLAIALERPDGSVSVFRTEVHPDPSAENQRYVERLLKFLLWGKGGNKVTIAGDPQIAECMRSIYSPEGRRAFDFEFMGERIYGH